MDEMNAIKIVPVSRGAVSASRGSYILTAAVLLAVMAISQAMSARLPARRSVTAGLPLLLICLATLEAALFAKALWLFLAGTVIGGIAVGFIFRGSLSELNRLADPRHRAGVVSTFFAAAYAGLGLTAVLTGLISLRASTVDASVYTSGLVAAIVVAAIPVVLRTFGTTPAPEPACAPSDAWCSPQEPASGGAGRVSVGAGGKLARGASD
jgi:hypothetical protein